ncbi:PREDICTED: caffeic acid 3-O-methyltransferase 1-like [Ipomoea nil]|uniref:caffeic acid 3-O-methyltransferase 1-like n=1 Tax=Ipomoea nil TaxID=35883 RepID=UPI0009017ED7|nr:PREDICTED: caffeic acid 3-O-methyltransferase 1-like [Ipomoea nil]
MGSESDNGARLRIMELANMISVPMSLCAVIRLNVADAIWQGGSNAPLSASEILSSVLPSGGGDAPNLERLLRMLTSYGIFREHINADASERRYSVDEVGKTLVTDKDGLSYGAYVLQHHQAAMMKAWPLVHEAVVDSSIEPFVKVNGEAPYSYYGKNPEMNSLMQKAMSGISVPFMKAFLDSYQGFKGVTRLVDVGGSAGDCLRMIVEKHPSITQAINFDFPEVVQLAPNIPGVTHVGGDVFTSAIPNCDAIFMKSVLTAWSDEECKAIMNNCYAALSQGGKLIVCEPVLPIQTDDTQRTRFLLGSDIFIMNMYRAKRKHWTEEAYRQLGLSVGFRTFKAYYMDFFLAVLEFHK